MATGVGVADDLIEQFEAFKLQREPYNLRFYTYKIEDGLIVVDQTGPREATYEDFCGCFLDNPDDPRYGLFDLEYQTDDGRPTSKLILFSYAPDTAGVRAKMLYSGSKAALKSVLTGVTVNITATDASELDYDTVLQAAKRFG
mmetsp:Transcript_16895/g.21693  ORF Transcript_16895/g.21693 Transcript_16895/m.21693 type:complete len:143 (-) Transcript_16895:205-633(-)